MKSLMLPHELQLFHAVSDAMRTNDVVTLTAREDIKAMKGVCTILRRLCGTDNFGLAWSLIAPQFGVTGLTYKDTAPYTESLRFFWTVRSSSYVIEPAV